MREIKANGDSALSIYFGKAQSERLVEEITAFRDTISNLGIEGIIEMIPCFTSLFVRYNPLIISFENLRRRLLELEITEVKHASARRFEIPLCYDFGLDFEHIGMSKDEVAHLHSSTIFRVFMLGFVAGFPYLFGTNEGMDKRLHTKRLSTPRTSIEAGSVGIAESMSGIYPISSPGGWNIIGKTPVNIFDKHKGALLRAGDFVRFIPISKSEFEEISIKGSQCLGL